MSDQMRIVHPRKLIDPKRIGEIQSIYYHLMKISISTLRMAVKSNNKVEVINNSFYMAYQVRNSINPIKIVINLARKVV